MLFTCVILSFTLCFYADIFLSLEAFARICVSGFLLDPEIPVSALFTSIFAPHMDPVPSSTSHPPLSRQPSRYVQGPIGFTEWVRQIKRNIKSPFALYDRTPPPSYTYNGSSAPAGSISSRTHTKGRVVIAAQKMHSHIRNPSNPTFLSTVLKSDQPSDVLSLPFRLSITNAYDKTRRNVPYLRHSWTRIDFVAIVSFWISFALATAGVERGNSHIGIFRAMSVIRITRLFTITSGTTVGASIVVFCWLIDSTSFQTIMRSLKIAAPLLTSVAYFVLFAIVLFSFVFFVSQVLPFLIQ